MTGVAPWAVHGGRLDAARRAYPQAPEPWIDLSTGISPFPYPLPSFAPEDWTRLPEPDTLSRVERLAGQAFGVDGRAEVVAGPGSELLLRLLPRLRAPSKVAVMGPTYGSHADAWKAHHVEHIDDLPAAKAADAVVVVSPNNPDGRVVAPERLAGLAVELAAKGGWLVVDEAFGDFEDGVAGAVEQWPRGLVVLRSFGKTYGLAGVRLGFALAHPALAGSLRGLLGDWPVSGPALRIAALAYPDRSWRAQTAERLTAAGRRLDELLTRAGGRIVGGTSLFRLTEWPDGAELFDRLARAAILTRPFADTRHRLRFGLPADKDAWWRLETVLSKGRS